MNITVKANFGVTERQLNTQSTTLGQLLDELSTEYGGSTGIADIKSKDVNHYFLVLLNGQTWNVLANGLDTELKEGDTVAVWGTFLLAGG
ncbi:MoaD/ThiS family protein [Chloroflexota bacterium]